MLFAFLLFLSVQPAYAEERSFRIGEVDIHARIDSVGDMHVTEEDTYHFDGVFNGIIVDLDESQSDGIVDFQAVEAAEQGDIPLRSELTTDGSKLQYRVYSASQDETKVFRFTYTVKNVVQVYADTAELYWKFFDDRNQNTLESVTIAVELPEGGEREAIHAFGHGPESGIVKVEDGGVVQYQVGMLQPGALLEARVLFPGSYVPDSMKVSPDAMLEAILEEERKWAEGPGIETVYGALILLIVNLAGGIYAKFFRRHRPEWTGKYYRELPSDITPAVVGYLHKYKVLPRDLMATMVDLVRKKHVSMAVDKEGKGKRKTDYTFRYLGKENDDSLLPHETLLIQWFFREIGKNNTVSLAGIRKYTKSPDHRGTFNERWTQWKDEVVNTADNELGLIENQKWLRRFIQYALVAQFLGLLLLAPSDWKWLMICSIPLLFLIPKKKRRTKAGQTAYVKWNAFRRFLRDYSRIESREPMAVHLWEHYFVYAIPLGVAKKMIAITRLKVPGAEVDSGIDSSYFYHWTYWTNSFQGSVQAANQSSSSNSGGSFSSGGGGGGGGGGRGAF